MWSKAILNCGEILWFSHRSPSNSIIAVHGLGGRASDTWTHPDSRTFWLKDLLPDRLPGVRTLTFGYNARRLKHAADLTFADVATQLIAGIQLHRTTPQVSVYRLGSDVNLLSNITTHIKEQSRPIIFIAHSLGGLIVKKVRLSLRPNLGPFTRFHD